MGRAARRSSLSRWLPAIHGMIVPRAKSASGRNGTVLSSLTTGWPTLPNASCAKAARYLEGALQTRKWTDQSGQERYTTEVIVDRFRGELVLLDSRNAGEGGEDGYGRKDSYGAGYTSANSSSRPSGNTNNGGFAAPQAAGDLDDEIPF